MEGKMVMETMDKNEQREILKKYLGQYCRNKNKKEALKRRLGNIMYEMLGAKSVKYSSVPKSITNSIGNAPLDFVIKCEEIEERIKTQQKEMPATMLKVLDILDFLDTGSVEREILEYKYLDGDSWEKISKLSALSRTQCILYWNRGIDRLLEFKSVSETMKEYDKKLQKFESPYSTVH
ncbi:MAG: hypothetical protein ACLT3H_02715 [Roseburia sp.]